MDNLLSQTNSKNSSERIQLMPSIIENMNPNRDTSGVSFGLLCHLLLSNPVNFYSICMDNFLKVLGPSSQRAAGLEMLSTHCSIFVRMCELTS